MLEKPCTLSEGRDIGEASRACDARDRAIESRDCSSGAWCSGAPICGWARACAQAARARARSRSRTRGVRGPGGRPHRREVFLVERVWPSRRLPAARRQLSATLGFFRSQRNPEGAGRRAGATGWRTCGRGGSAAGVGGSGPTARGRQTLRRASGSAAPDAATALERVRESWRGGIRLSAGQHGTCETELAALQAPCGACGRRMLT